MKAVRIEWDTDVDNEALAFLPEEIELPEGVSDEESISDYFSEQTGFCHRGYVLSVLIYTSSKAEKNIEFCL